MRLPHVAAVLVLALAAGPVAAQGKVDDPEFANWSKFKKGTSVTYRSDVPRDSINTVTLIEVGPDKLVLESRTTVTVGNRPHTYTEKREVRKTRDLPEGYTKEDIARGRPRGTTEEGTEVVTINGVEYKTRWFKYADVAYGAKWAGKQWVCDDVPGRVVKVESTYTPQDASIEINIELIEIKKP